MRGVSIELLPDPPAAEVRSAICAADELGLHTAFLADEIYHRDAWMILAAAAQRTTRIRLAPGVAHVTLRDPLLVAQQLATLDELTGGRAAAAFSVGNLAMLEQFGFDPAEAFVVGDHAGDVGMGRSIGATTFLVMTGHGPAEVERAREDADHVVPDLAAAVDIIALLVTGERTAHRPREGTT